MALTMPSPNSVAPSPFSFYNDSASSPTSSKGSRDKDAPRISEDSLALPPTSPYPQNIEPSPVDSNGTAGTDTTEIDETPQDHEQSKNTPAKTSTNASPISPTSQLGKLDTTLAASPAPDEDSNPQSVIHAPEQFKQFPSTNSPAAKAASSGSPSDRSGHTVLSPLSPRNRIETPLRRDSSTSPLKTDLPPSQIIDRSTPQAQTLQEAEEEWKRRKSHSASLADIPETADGEPPSATESKSSRSQDVSPATKLPTDEHQQHIETLKSTLDECWTVCKSMANLSSKNRARVFAHQGPSSVQEQAWETCWRLCQNLYETRGEDHDGLILPTLELCREFCQALFDARLRGDELSDSVLRVSFELNNHLYNTHDRNLPSAFQERTLDFYLTLCHRLMKQRTCLPPETDALLRACWTLAEMLFNIRQNTRETGDEDEELLSSAMQACWELGDLFRDSFMQARPATATERGTPRAPYQAFSSFSPTSNSIRSNSLFSSQSSPSATRSSSAHSYNRLRNEPKPFPPETPTTIFEDVNESPVGADEGNVPNILVLGPEQAGSRANANRWADSASTLSGYTESSQRTSSTATAPGQSSATAANLTRIRVLLLRAAYTAGFKPRSGSQGTVVSPKTLSASGSASATITSPTSLAQQNDALIFFVKNLPVNAFGTAAWQIAIVDNYKRFVIAWPKIISSSVSSSAIMKGDGTPLRKPKANTEDMHRVSATLVTTGSAQTRTNANEISSAVRWMCRKESNNWLIDLYRAVFGGNVEEATNGTAVIQA